MGKNGKSTKHRKTRGFLAVPGGRRQGARPLSPTERRETPSARTRPGGPWPDYESQPGSWLVAICERSENRGSGGGSWQTGQKSGK